MATNEAKAAQDQTAAQAKPAVPAKPVVAKLYPDEINVKKVTELTGLTDLRIKTLAREGRIPTGKKNDLGFWKFSEAAVKEWFKNRPVRTGGGGAKDGRRTYRIRLNDEEAALVSKAVAGAGIELRLANPPKAKEAPAA